MKKLSLITVAVLLLSILCGCNRVKLEEDASVILTFSHDQTAFQEVLSLEDSEIVIRILQDKLIYDTDKDLHLPEYDGTTEPTDGTAEPHSCGFSAMVSVTADGKTYAMSRDDCTMLQDVSTGELIVISDYEREQIIAIFEKYGGYFPCA